MFCYRNSMKHRCPLCYTILTYTSASTFARCIECDAYVKDPFTYLSSDNEKKHYDNHQNSCDNADYLAFLTPLAHLIEHHCDTFAYGLDFGCGPVFALQSCLSASKKLDHYDFYYHPNMKVFSNTYDFIVLSEVIEHLHQPYKELKRLF